MSGNIKCRYFTKNGNVIHGGCKAVRCRFMHPEDDRFWTEVPTRCKFFHDSGRSVRGGCKFTKSSECPYAHPEEPEWMGRRRPKPPGFSASTSSVQPLASSVPSNVETKGKDRPFTVPAQSAPFGPPPQILQVKRIEDNNKGLEERKSIKLIREGHALSGSPREEGFISEPSTPTLTSSINTTMSNIPTKVTSGPSINSTFNPQVWEDRMSILAKATKKCQEFSDSQKDLLINNPFIESQPSHLIPELRRQTKAHHSSLLTKHREVEETLKRVDSELDGTGFWSLPVIPRQSEKHRPDVDPLLQIIETLRGQSGKIEQSVQIKRDRRLEQTSKFEVLQESLSSSYETVIQRTIALEGRLQTLRNRIDDEEEALERDQQHLGARFPEFNTSHAFIKAQGQVLDNMSSYLASLRKEIVDLIDLNPPLNALVDGHSETESRLSLIVGRQENADKQMAQILQGVRQYCLDSANQDPVAEALRTFQTDISLALDKCIGERTFQLEEITKKGYDDTIQTVEALVDPIVNMLDIFFQDLTSLNVS